MTPEQAAQLLTPFPPETIGKLPRIICPNCSKAPTKVCAEHNKVQCRDCGNYISTRHIHLDYVGHAAVTKRLLDVDSEWTWEPVAVEANGAPALANGGLWIRLTIGGTSRLGWGDGPDIKQMISDAIRNAAMRFGVALDLWSKDDIRAEEHSTSDAPDDAPSELSRPAPAAPERVAALAAAVKDCGLADWVKDQGFPWPWSVSHCDAIAAKVADAEFVQVGDEDSARASSRVGGPESQEADQSDEAHGVGSLTPPTTSPPLVPPESDVVGRSVASYATQTAETVNLPPCAEDASKTVAGAEKSGVLSADQIRAEVREMSLPAVTLALDAANLSTNGGPKPLRERLVQHRLSTEPF